MWIKVNIGYEKIQDSNWDQRSDIEIHLDTLEGITQLNHAI